MPKESHIYVWNFILRYESLILIFVTAHRVKVFPLYVFRSYGKTYTSIFSLDHVNYSRWVPFLIGDMKFLPGSIRV